MAKFKMELPTEVMKDIQRIYDNYEDIFGGMTRAGAEEVKKAIEGNVPEEFHGSDIMNCLEITKNYKTPSDDGINTKVAFYNYFKNHLGKRTPAPLVCNIFEYGRSVGSRGGYIQKKPFLRKSFNKKKIEKVMLEAQKKLTGGLLDE